MVITFRTATDRDKDFTKQVHHLALRSVVEAQYGAWDEKYQDDYFETKWWSPNKVQIIQINSIDCGYLVVEEKENEMEIVDIVITPAFQGQGIGTIIIQGIFEKALHKGCSVKIKTQLQNRAYNFYRKLGFKETGRTKTHYQMQWNPKCTN